MKSDYKTNSLNDVQLNTSVLKQIKNACNTWTAICSWESRATDATETFTGESNLTNTSI